MHSKNPHILTTLATRPQSSVSRFIGLMWLLLVLMAAPLARASDGGGGSIVELPGPCGTQPLSIARMQWPSSVVLAYVHALILKQELGCEVQVIAGDLAASVSSMATTGQPAIAPEMWVTRITSIWNSTLESGHVRSVASSFSGGNFEGWYIPAHVAEAEPDLSSADQLAQYGAKMLEAGEKAQFISCPADWACSVINTNLLTAYGLNDLFEVIEPANRFEMDTLIARAVSRSRPLVFYYWQPNPVLAQFDFKALNMGVYNAENFTCLARRNCPTPQVSAFVPETVFIAISDWVAEEAPGVVRYLQRASMPLDEMNALLARKAESGESFEDVAAEFVANRQEIWQKWVQGL